MVARKEWFFDVVVTEHQHVNWLVESQQSFPDFSKQPINSVHTTASGKMKENCNETALNIRLTPEREDNQPMTKY